MAIALDNVNNLTPTTATSSTLSHTCTGSNLLLVVGLIMSSSDNTITTSTLTYAGTTMLPAVENNSVTYVGRLYYLLSPTTGANNVSLTLSTSTFYNYGLVAASYTGVSALDVHNQANGSSSQTTSVSLTTTVANDLLVMIQGDDGYNAAHLASGGSTVQYTGGTIDSFNSGAYVDKILSAAAGTYTIVDTNTSMGTWNAAAAAFKPAAGGVVTATGSNLMSLGVG